MLSPFAHEALLDLAEGADPRAAGGAITVALCGHWDHQPPCPLAPHRVSTQEQADGLLVRVVFAAQPQDEATARGLIEQAVRSGELVGPDGRLSAWRWIRSGPIPLSPRDAPLAQQLSARA